MRRFMNCRALHLRLIKTEFLKIRELSFASPDRRLFFSPELELSIKVRACKPVVGVTRN